MKTAIEPLRVNIPQFLMTKLESIGRGFIVYDADFNDLFWSPFREKGEDNLFAVAELNHGKTVLIVPE